MFYFNKNYIFLVLDLNEDETIMLNELSEAINKIIEKESHTNRKWINMI